MPEEPVNFSSASWNVYNDQVYHDEYTGFELPKALVKAGRGLEMTYVYKHNVNTKVPLEVASYDVTRLAATFVFLQCHRNDRNSVVSRTATWNPPSTREGGPGRRYLCKRPQINMHFDVNHQCSKLPKYRN